MRCSRRLRLRASLLLLLSSHVCSTFADDNFIVQPKLRSNTPRDASATATLPTSTKQASQPQQPQTAGAGVFQSPNHYASPFAASHNQLASEPMRGAVDTSSDLRWVSRNELQDRASSNRGRAIPASSPNDSQSVVLSARPNPRIPATTASHAEPKDEKQVLAALVSSRLIDGIQQIDQPRVQAIDNAPGWQAVGERLTIHLQAADKLLRRKAIHSAREEAEAAALYLTRTLDLAVNSYASEPGWRAAEQAFREARDFYFHQSSDESALRRVVDSHLTPVLKTADLSKVSPLIAAQHYRQYAFENLIEASQGHPWASEVMCTLARTYQAEAELSGGISDEMRSRAATYYRAAVEISPRNSLAANQLGFLLLKMDRPQEALQTLVQALKTEASEPALENVVEASRRLGNSELQNWAMQQLSALRSRRPATPAVPAVTEVDVQSFISLSPYNSGPHPGMAPPPASQPAQQPSYTATVPRSFR